MRLLLGAYVLDALTPEENRMVAEHLRDCSTCGAEYLDMTEAQQLLSMITEADLLAGPDEGVLGGRKPVGDAEGDIES
ncbi:zf-HC2 domain-containing protein [Streptomyces sp. NPDC056632]|uniref:zf-HC2 domain-containing protein n=1 Tax=Streptomyces sp. NPDC056632 TaxID=3345884 RepID=UPI0036A2B28F